MTTTNKDFAVKQGIRLVTGITFGDGSYQDTAAISGTFNPDIDGGAPDSFYSVNSVDGGTP